MNLTSLKGTFGNYKQKGLETNHSKWELCEGYSRRSMKLTSLKGSFNKVEQTRHEADHSKSGALLIIKQTGHVADLCKGEIC